MGGMQIARPSPPAAPGIVPVRLVGVRFTNQGAYTFSLQIEGQQEQITHDFAVRLAEPRMIGGSLGVGMPGAPPV